MLVEQERLEPGSEAFEKRLAELRARMEQYARYRLYPEMPDWEIMGFYPMSKRRTGSDNWYQLGFPSRKMLMAGHAQFDASFPIVLGCQNVHLPNTRALISHRWRLITVIRRPATVATIFP